LLKTKTAAYQKKSVQSKDGTTIGFRQLGEGPGVVILHGGALASQHNMKLGAALASEFTVYIPDRRGRGMSGPCGPDYTIAREDEDLQAIVAETGAEYVFGSADGGLFALHASMTTPAIRKVAAFEPVVFVGQPGLDDFKRGISEGKRRLESDGVAAAMASLTSFAMGGQAERSKESVTAPYRMLGWALAQPSICRVLLWADARMVRGDNVALRDLLPALIPELELVKATEGTIDQYRNVTAEVLILAGDDAVPLFTDTLDALEKVLPNWTRVDLPGVNHGAPQDQGGQPAVIADQLRRFFRPLSRSG
jgi:pimeloyl-ACP methyl ester carboxylesterase